jgi:geranylgeranyl diphosphate synthase type II
VFAGGKRVRPILCLESARIFCADIEAVLPIACALELIHTYSLIHDDLPALDNDDLRRGLPTSHKKFGEATAILAGDALLTLAFETLATAPVEHARRIAVIHEIAAAAGTRNGMIGGQVEDLESEKHAVTPDMLEYIHRSKTAALIRAAIVAGAIAGGAGDADLLRLRAFGDNIGWAFQVIDDILDVEESSATLGKTAGKDQAQQKATYPALFGLAKSHEFADELANRARLDLEPYSARAQRLRELAEFLVLRRA